MHVFRTVADPFVGQIAMLRVLSGTLRPSEIGAVAKLAGSPSGTLLWTRTQGRARLAPLPRRQPVYAVTLTPASPSDDAKLSGALSRLLAEDPTPVLDRVGGETILRASATRTSPSCNCGSRRFLPGAASSSSTRSSAVRVELYDGKAHSVDSSETAFRTAAETTADGRTRIVAGAPEAELARYVLELRSLTAGQAELAIAPDRYERAPEGHRA